MSLTLAKFKMSNIVFTSSPGSNGPVIVMIGRRDTGKSILVRDLLYFHQHIPVGTVISGTEAGNGFYSQLVPKLFIHDNYDSSIVNNVLVRQRKLVKGINRDIANNKRNTTDPRTFLILDDCLYDDKWTRDILMRQMFMNGECLP